MTDLIKAAGAEQVNTPGLEAQDVLESPARKAAGLCYQPFASLIKLKCVFQNNITSVPDDFTLFSN